MAQEGGVEMIHIDVMDGHFVPNITFGTLIVDAVRKILPKAFLDVHLMIQNPRIVTLILLMLVLTILAFIWKLSPILIS